MKRFITKLKNSKRKSVYLYSVLFFIFVAALCILQYSYKGSLVTNGDAYNCYYPVYVYIGNYFREIPHNISKYGVLPVYDFLIGFGNNIFETVGFGDVYNLTSVFLWGNFLYLDMDLQLFSGHMSLESHSFYGQKSG